MEIIRSGGFDKYITEKDERYHLHGAGNCVLVQLKSEIDTKVDQGPVLIVTAAKPKTDHYNDLLNKSGYDLNRLKIVGKDTNEVE